MWSCLWRPKSRDKSLLGYSLSTFLEPETCTFSLCYSLYGGLFHALADSAQFKHNLHYDRSVKPPIHPTETELLELRTRWRGSHLGHAGSSDDRDRPSNYSRRPQANRRGNHHRDGYKHHLCNRYYDE